MCFANNLRDGFGGDDAVLERNKHGIRTKHGFAEFRSALRVPQLHREHDDIDQTDGLWVVIGLNVFKHLVSIIAGDGQAVVLDGLQVRTPGDKGDVLPSLSEFSAKNTTNTARRHDCNLHGSAHP